MIIFLFEEFFKIALADVVFFTGVWVTAISSSLLDSSQYYVRS